MTRSDGFPEAFLWGCSNSSYQTEGSVRSGGRGESIWDTFCRVPGAIADGLSGEVACDSWNRMAEDVALLRGLGVDAYRLSLAWPRIQPNGSGRPVQEALDRYARLLDLLREAGIEPWVTLYHWDLPQTLEDAGGWLSRETARRFGDFAEIAYRALGSRAGAWVTLNEPWCSAWLGYGSGEHAPGKRLGTGWLPAAHHLLLGHGLAVEACRGVLPGARIGLVLNPATPRPATRRPEDLEAARIASIERTGLWLDPVYGRGYPEVWLASQGASMPVEGDDLARIAAPIDFIGVNYYNEDVVRAPDAGAPAFPGYVYEESWQDRTEMGWSIVPSGLTRILRAIHDEWAPGALYVTENGAAFADQATDGRSGRVRDLDRIAYHRSHIAACRDALSGGVPLKGYFAWTLMDNFEWSFGFSRKFGLVSVDRGSGERRPKDSYYWYRDMVAGRGAI